MPIIGVIAEYNPFHYGHGFQITTVRRQYPAAHIIAVMCGSITQRGEPCILDKWVRAGHAVEGGADLVLELPFVFACRSAQDFARGGIILLARLGIVSHLVFGMEAEQLAPLAGIAACIDSEDLQRELGSHLDTGCSYAEALTRALTKEKGISKDMLRAPNNILAIEYLRALRQFAPQITPIGIQRAAAQHSDSKLRRGISSASSIRHALSNVPPPWKQLETSVQAHVLTDLKEGRTQGLPQEDRLLNLLRYQLLITDSPALKEIYGIAEGIEHRLICSKAQSYRNFLAEVSTKRYPQSRIARLIIYLLLHLKKTETAAFDLHSAAYIRPLAFNARGRELLHLIKHTSSLPIITRTAAFLTSAERTKGAAQLSCLQRMLAFDTRATELRSLTIPARRAQNQRTDFIMSPVFLR